MVQCTQLTAAALHSPRPTRWRAWAPGRIPRLPADSPARYADHQAGGACGQIQWPHGAVAGS
eukprot:350940-Chlamydomonas_euryale.AAC.6